MAVVYVYTKPARQMLERVAAEMGLDHLRQQSGIERARRDPRQAARSHSRLSTARSKPSVCPIRMRA